VFNKPRLEEGDGWREDINLCGRGEGLDSVCGVMINPIVLYFGKGRGEEEKKRKIMCNIFHSSSFILSFIQSLYIFIHSHIHSSVHYITVGYHRSNERTDI